MRRGGELGGRRDRKWRVSDRVRRRCVAIERRSVEEIRERSRVLGGVLVEKGECRARGGSNCFGSGASGFGLKPDQPSPRFEFMIMVQIMVQSQIKSNCIFFFLFFFCFFPFMRWKLFTVFKRE